MPGMSDALEVLIRTHLMRAGTWSKSTARWVSLHTADPTDTGGGTEVTGGSYARVQRDASDANWTAVSATDGLCKNAAPLTFPAPTANWGVVTHFGIWDASTSGTFLIGGTLTPPKTINDADAAPVFAADALVITIG